MPSKAGKMTPQERRFVEVYAVTQDAAYAATKAHYRTPGVQGPQKLAKPALVEEIKRQQIARLNNDLLPLALNLIESVILDAKETTRNRLTAAKIVVDRTIGQGGEAGEDKEPHEMTPSELQARIDRLRREQAERAKPVIEGELSEDKGSVFE